MSAPRRPWLIPRVGRKIFVGAGVVSGLIVVTVILSVLGGGESAIFDPAAIDTSGLDGETLFAASCARCHGSNLQGSQFGPPLLDDIYRPAHHPDAAFISAVRIGVRSHHWSFGNMPPIADLSDGELAAIIQFIREIQEDAGVE